MKMDHDRCSDLLLPYLRGDLDEDATREVEEHLAGCDECRVEQQGLALLIGEPDESLTDLERATLHRDLRSRVSVPASSSTPDKERLTWLPSALGVAALLLAVVVGMQLGGGGGDNEATSGGSGADAGVEDAAPDGPRPATLTLSEGGVRVLATEGAALEGAADSEVSAESDEVDSEAAVPNEDSKMERQNGDGGVPSFSSRRLSVEDQLKSFARTSPTFVRFARSYTVEDVESLTVPFISDLADGAPPGASVQVTECAELVVSSREFPTLPAAAAHGKFRGDRSLLLGFVWTPEDEGPLDNYVLYVWPSGSCDSPSHSQSGRIRTRGR